MEPQQETRRWVQGKCRGPFAHVLGAVLCDDLAKATYKGTKSWALVPKVCLPLCTWRSEPCLAELDF